MSAARQDTAAPWAGALRIIRFNWPSYLLALAICASCLLVFSRAPSGAIRAATLLILLPTGYWTLISIAASHWVYDRSPLNSWTWLPGWLTAPPGRWLLIQTAFDSTQGRLARQLPPTGLPVFDIYELPGVGGGSIRRARKERQPGGAAPTVSRMPAQAGGCDSILAVFALHEIRDRGRREAFFLELVRALAPGGQLLLVEHLRDWKNFLVYGPGFFHFLPEREWRRCALRAGLRPEKSESITPFVRAFLWSKP
jgi:hypothetical protein